MSLGSASKKTTYSPERNRPEIVKERELFIATQACLDSEKLVFIDESGCHPGIGPMRGWSPRGSILSGPEQPYARGQHVSMVAALTLKGISALMTVDGGVKTLDFARFVTQRLVPTLRPGDIICWDNINMHKNAHVVNAVESAGATILKRPRYSPDLNAIEAAWAKAKHWIRKLAPSTVPELKDAMRRALHRIRGSDAAGWIKYCGYSL